MNWDLIFKQIFDANNVLMKVVHSLTVQKYFLKYYEVAYLSCFLSQMC